MEGWVGLVGWPIADALPTKWSHVNRGSGVNQGKSAGYRPTSFPLTHAAYFVMHEHPLIQENGWPNLKKNSCGVARIADRTITIGPSGSIVGVR